VNHSIDLLVQIHNVQLVVVHQNCRSDIRIDLNPRATINYFWKGVIQSDYGVILVLSMDSNICRPVAYNPSSNY
jgi:hypothetical protein